MLYQPLCFHAICYVVHIFHLFLILDMTSHDYLISILKILMNYCLPFHLTYHLRRHRYLGHQFDS